MLRTLLLSVFLVSTAWADGGIVAPDAGSIVTRPPLDAPLLVEVEHDGEATIEKEASAEDAARTDGGILYSAELTDEELLRRWVEEPASLGSISMGMTEAGRLMNGVAMPAGDAWEVVDPANTWGTQETIDFIAAAAVAVRAQFSEAPPLRINHIGRENGGHLSPHRSHQAGRDVDLGFYYPNGLRAYSLKTRELAMDLEVNWALLKALITLGDVQFVLVDKRIQNRLYTYALDQGENKAWLDTLFRAGTHSLVRHARGHRDHFHVRYFAGRSQELGYRIMPLLAKQPAQNIAMHKVAPGDTLGRLAARYNTAAHLIQKANGLSSGALRVGRTLNIPLRAPCARCPRPAAVVVPPRCLPPEPPPKS